MNDVWLVSDTHFGHGNLMVFKGYDGKPLRDFKDANHMNEYIVEKWNSVVKPDDKVYHLGDVAMHPINHNIKIMSRLNGRKTLILGNHDDPDINVYKPYFKRIYSTRMLDWMLLSHVPIHPMSLGKADANIFGHVHNNITPGQYGPKYYNISIEVLDDYTPIHVEDLKNRIKKQLQEEYVHPKF